MLMATAKSLSKSTGLGVKLLQGEGSSATDALLLLSNEHPQAAAPLCLGSLGIKRPTTGFGWLSLLSSACFSFRMQAVDGVGSVLQD